MSPYRLGDVEVMFVSTPQISPQSLLADGEGGN